MNNQDTITIIMPALNEEGSLRPTYQKISGVIEKFFCDYEIFIFNDGSTDKTGQIAEEISSENPKVRVFHHKTPMNVGYIYKSGVKMATKDYVLLVASDNDVLEKAFEDTFNLRHSADIVIPYHLNPHIRPWGRRILSNTVRVFLNTVFGLDVKYYTGMVLHKTKIIQSINIYTDSFFYQAEALVKLLTQGYSYVQFGIELIDRQKGRSKAINIKNMVGVLKALYNLMRELKR